MLVIPLNPAALARIDKLDRMIVELERGLPKLRGRKWENCKVTIRKVRAQFAAECNKASMHEHGIALTEGKGAAGYRVRRYADGRAKGLVWDRAAKASSRKSDI